MLPRRAAGGRAGARQPERLLPRRPRVRPRGAARACARPRRRWTRRRRSSASCAAWSRRTSCAASSPTCGRRSPTSRASRAGAIPLLNQFRSLSSCLNEVAIPWSQRHHHRSGDARDGPGVRGARLRRHSASRARAAPATRTARTSGCSRAAAPNTVVMPDPVQGTVRPAGGRHAAADPRRPCRRSTRRRKTQFRPDVPCETQEPPEPERRPGGPGPDAVHGVGAVRRSVTPELSSALAGLEAPLDRAANLLDGERRRRRSRARTSTRTRSRQIADLVAQAYGIDYLRSLAGDAQ